MLEYKKFYANDTLYTYDEPNQLYQYTYDNLGRNFAVEVNDIDAANVDTYLYDYDDQGQITEVNTPQGTVYYYDESGNLVQTDLYDESDNLLTRSRTLYDAEGRTLVTVGPYDPCDPNAEPVGTETVYDEFGRVIETARWADVDINLVDLVVNSKVVGKKVPDDAAPDNAWDGTGNEPSNIGWTCDDGNLPVVGSELSYSITEYDAVGRVKTTISLDENGYEWPTSYEYDNAGKQTAVIDPCGHDITRDGKTIATAEPNENLGYRTETEYLGTRRSSVTDANDNTTEFKYDAVGRVVKTIYPSVSPHGPTYGHVGYDSLGRRTWQSEQTVYSDGNAPSIIGKEFEYDDVGRLRAVILPDVNDPCNNDTRTYPRYEYDYDTYGNLVCIRDNIKQYADHTVDYNYARETSFTYGPLHNQTSRRLPDGRIEFKQYDQFARLIKSTDFAAQITGFEYTGCCNLLDYKRYYVDESAYIADNPTSEIQYTYDNFRRKNQVYVDDVLQQDFYYDSEGRIEALYSPQGWIKYEYHMVTGARKSTSAFDASLNYGELTAGNTDTKVSYAYDELARLKTVTANKRNGQDVNEMTEYAYNPVGSAKNVVYANGNLAQYSYDALNRLTNLTNYQDDTKAVTLSSFAYTLAADGTRQTVTESDGTVITWTYDNLKRVTEEDYDAPGSADDYTHGYIYDLVANRLKRSVDGGADTVYTYGPNNDRLLTETTGGNTITYYYDDNGALINRVYGTDPNADPNDSYQYNLFGRLSQAAPNGLSTVTYTYNPDGLRVGKQINGGPTIDLLIDRDNHTGYSQVLKETVSNDANIVYIIGRDILAQAVEGSEPNYFLYDGQGSVRQLAGSAGALTSGQAYNFDAYGNLINSVTPQTSLLYTGEMWEPYIGGYNLRARDYRPDIGLFMTMDAFAGNHLDPLSLHKYTYAHGNPVNGNDPTGSFFISGYLGVFSISRIMCLQVPVVRGSREESKLKFNAWYQKQQLGAWWEVLPKCPCRITVKDGKASYTGKDKKKWDLPARPHEYEERLHPKITFSMRSLPKERHTNQCTYDKEGKLFTGNPQAGTVDFRAAGTTGHLAADVYPLHWAVHVDTGIVMHVTRGPKTPTLRPGYVYMKRYYQKRPLWDRNCPENELKE